MDHRTLAEQYKKHMGKELQKQKTLMESNDVDLMSALKTIGNIHVTQVNAMEQIIRQLEERLDRLESARR